MSRRDRTRLIVRILLMLWFEISKSFGEGQVKGG
jgi:hypothetical protein